MFQESELINLFLAVFSAFVVFFFFRRQLREYRSFYLGFYLVISSLFFTVAEGVVFKELFNFLEHLGYALAGLAFLLACLQLSRQQEGEGGRQ